MLRSINPVKIIILGSGVYRIGSSVEFDWCAVTCAQTLRRLGFKVIMVNHNPETVSTDYDMADKLYFEELSFEVARDIYNLEQSDGLIISMGGQSPNNIAMRCHKAGLKILGTSAQDIDQAENRYKFSKLLNKIQIDQPAWKELVTLTEAADFAQTIGYPVLIRPSYVLSGAAMNVAFNANDLEQYLQEAVFISPQHPVVITKFIVGAKELEIDAVAASGQVIANIISEHVENAGVHSGDATIVCPPQKVYVETARRLKMITQKIAQALNITGPFNIQFLAKDNQIKVIECNLRASRSFPFVSKITGINLIELATEAIIARFKPRVKTKTKLKPTARTVLDLPFVGVKAPQFSFSRIKAVDPVLRVEMASTGEVGALGQTLEEAYLKSIIATGFKLPQPAQGKFTDSGVLLSLGGDLNKAKFLASAKLLRETGFQIYATHHTALYLEYQDIKTNRLYKLHELPQEPNIKTYILDKKIDVVIIINDFDYKKPLKSGSFEVDDDYQLRRAAVDFAVPILTNLQAAQLFVRAICLLKLQDLQIKSWEDYNDVSILDKSTSLIAEPN